MTPKTLTPEDIFSKLKCRQRDSSVPETATFSLSDLEFVSGLRVKLTVLIMLDMALFIMVLLILLILSAP